MNNALQLGKVAGISIRVHWTFFLLIAWLLFSSFSAGEDVATAFLGVAFILVLFGCVVLHELGHALAARMYGIATRDITLLPIGGLARLERMPKKPSQELVVALAGPAVNVVLAAILAIFVWPTLGTVTNLSEIGFLQRLYWVNIALVVFNMLPAFPMDGGRVLRALIAMVTNYRRATSIAATIGQALAVGLGLLGLFGANPILVLIAVFIFFAAGAENASTNVYEELQPYRVADGMIRNFHALKPYTPMRSIAEDLLNDSQRDFPVIHEGTFVGMVRREDLLSALARAGNPTVGDIMQSNVASVDPDIPLTEILENQSRYSGNTVPVLVAGRMVGILQLPQMMELIRAREILRGHDDPPGRQHSATRA